MNKDEKFKADLIAYNKKYLIKGEERQSKIEAQDHLAYLIGQHEVRLEDQKFLKSKPNLKKRVKRINQQLSELYNEVGQFATKEEQIEDDKIKLSHINTKELVKK